MKGISPLVLIGVGSLLLFVGFVYEILFAGIPLQDSTPEMMERYIRHSNIASLIYWKAFGVILIGVAAGIARLVGRLRSPSEQGSF